MNLSQLYYFRKLAELQHYTKAAKELYITQPSLSNAMSSLEKELGVALFQKTGRNIYLTKYGREFLEYVNEALERIDRGVAVMKSYAGSGDGGKIDLGCIITTQTDYVPKLLRDYRVFSGYEATANVRERGSDELINELVSGEFDVIIGAKIERQDITHIPVVAQKVVVAMSESCELAKKDFIVPEDLKNSRPLTYSDEIQLGKSMKRFMDEVGIANACAEYLDESILAGFAVNDVEVAVMLDTFLLHGVKDVVIRPLVNNAEEQRSFYHRIYFAYNKKSYHSYRIDHFINYVKTEKSLVDPEERPIYID